MDKVLIAILIMNWIGALIFIVKSLGKGQKVFLCALFIFLPVVGFGIYFLPLAIMKIRKNYTYDRASLVKRYEIRQTEATPFVERELNVVPIEDAMAISNNAEKRELLLEQLKKDMHRNYKVILPAGSDSDSETAHYVAAAKMEVYRQKHLELIAVKNKHKEHPDDVSILHEYLKTLEDYIESGLLAEKESQIYKAEYGNVLQELQGISQQTIMPEEYACHISYLLDLGSRAEVEKLWRELEDASKNETAYMRLLNMYYDLGDKEKFYQCLKKLEESGIELSPSGLKTLRYWRMRRN